MSSSDLELLAALFEAPFASYAELGRRVGMTGQGARKRLIRLEGEGVLRGMVATPVPGIFDREGAFVTVEQPSPRIEGALALDDVVLAGATLDDLFTVAGFVPPGTREGRRAAWRQALGAPLVYEGRYRDEVTPPTLGPLDWRVLRALLGSPRASVTDLAGTTGLTRRTVADRRQRLTDTGAVEVTPQLGPSDEGRLFFHLAVLGHEEPPAAVAAKLPGAVLTEQVTLAPDTATGHGTVLFCEAASLSDQHALVERARQLAGVTEARAYLLEEYHVHTDRLEGWIDEALDAWDAARG